MSIPKKIHYCWLSGEPFPDDIDRCIQSWHKFMPDYEFKLWDQKNSDIQSHPYVLEAVMCKKYAFASDFIRLWALYEFGGIYLDSDLEVLKSFNPLLSEKAFTGFEVGGRVAAWIFGSERHNPMIGELLSYYDNRTFVLENGCMDMTPNTVPVTRTFAEKGLKDKDVTQYLDDITVFSSDYFSPFNPWTKERIFTDNSYAMHLFKGAWMNDDSNMRFLSDISKNLEKIRNSHLNVSTVNIYGAGLVAHLLLNAIRKTTTDINIKTFIVSDVSVTFSEIDDIPVRSAGDIRIDRSIPVIVATMPKDYDDIKEKLVRENYNSIITLV
ncbi:glycosyltransferase family 32 protein [Lachnospiraceae bacterium C1.1]|nr:glycosyltransferase [Lachnospiraceae bacterium C1.1]